MKALIFGITGQAGRYLTEILLSQGYKVYGVHRRTSAINTSRISHLLKDIELIEGDVTDFISVSSIVKSVMPDRVYNLAAMSHVATSFEQPLYTFQATGISAINILESIRLNCREARIAHASSSEMFGKNYDTTNTLHPNVVKKYQNENTNMLPQSPYAIAKLAAHHSVRLYREAYGIFASSVIMHNYESPYRGENFVTKKITKWIGEFIKWKSKTNDKIIFFDENHMYCEGLESFPKLRLGNLDAYRDWSHAADTMWGFFRSIDVDFNHDYVLSSQETRSVRDFVELAFKYAGLNNYDQYIVIDPKFYRPAEVDYLLGDSSKARFLLNWEPRYTFQDLVKEMVEYETQG